MAADCRGEGGLAVVHVTDGPNVHVVLGPLEDFLGHLGSNWCRWAGARLVGWTSGPAGADPGLRRRIGVIDELIEWSC